MISKNHFRSYGYGVASLFALVGMAVIPGCSKRDSGGSKAKVKGAGMNLDMSSETPEQGADVELSVSAKEQILSVEWTVFKVGSDKSLTTAGMCAQSEVNKTICTFEEEGNYLARAVVKLVNGTLYGVQKEFTVKAPDGLKNQDPIIVLSMSGGNNSATVATFKNRESGDASFPQGTAIAFDFSQTGDDKTAAAAMKFEVKWAADAAFEPVSVSFSKTFTDVGVRVVTVRATDADGNKTEKTFALFVSCAVGSGGVTELSLNNSKIVVAPSADAVFAGVNWHTYTAAGIASGGAPGAKLKYKWDFNGDGLFDTDWISEATLPYPVYSNHMNSRAVKVKVWDTMCNFVKETSKAVSLDASPFFVSYASDDDLAAGPKNELYGYYIQGKVRGKSAGTQNLATTNVDSLNADKAGAGYKPKRVMCEYSKPRVGEKEASKPLPQGNFHIYGLERYQDRTKSPLDPTDKNAYKQDGLFHGIDLRMNGFAEDLAGKGKGAITVIDSATSGEVKPVVTFFTDRQSDNTLERQFTSSACNIKFVVQVAGDGDPCAPIVINTPDYKATVPIKGAQYPVRIWGTYNCPSMSDARGETVQLDDGAFFCEDMKIDACVGCCCCCCCCGVPPIPQ